MPAIAPMPRPSAGKDTDDKPEDDQQDPGNESEERIRHDQEDAKIMIENQRSSASVSALVVSAVCAGGCGPHGAHVVHVRPAAEAVPGREGTGVPWDAGDLELTGVECIGPREPS